MLRAATGLVAFDSYKLWVHEPLTFASNELRSIDVHRADALPGLSIWAPNLQDLGLQACYGLEFLEFPETHATLSALLPRSHEPTTFDVNTQNANLGRAAAAALARNPRARSSAHPRMPIESMFANMGGMF